MLTKSKFKKFVECPNEFWLDHHFPEPAGKLDLNAQLRRETGYEVESLARTHPIFAARDDVKIEFGKEFQTETLYAKADVVVTVLATGDIEIYEIKSGTSAKDEYKLDLAFQFYVATQAGYVVSKACLIFLDNTYIFDGVLDTESLLCISDETEAINILNGTIRTDIETALAFRDGDEPAVTLLDYCKANKLGCRSILKQFPDIPEYNVSNIFSAGSKKLNTLLEEGILNLCDIPADFKLTDREAAIIEVERSGQPYIDRETILGELNELKFPLQFLDYESFNPGVPKFHRTRPYQQMVFQYSLHTLGSEGGELRHSFHLSRNDGRHPSKEIVERLYEDLNGNIGTVIIWSEGFEKTRNTELGVMFPEYADFLAEVNDAVYDLRKVFSRRLYLHPGFRGRDSIKKVLPVLCPHLPSYDDMDIGDGLTASIKWFHIATGRGTSEEREKTYEDLCAYCHLDTLAMVEIYRHLLSI
ncbi:MAG: DUF2779 domain-containing protein [Acidobacteria bacterium]|nr:DUF2779 domain-containing protein [Acidobacteriota bacterium]